MYVKFPKISNLLLTVLYTAFHPPHDLAAIQALLEHSQKTYMHLPLELRISKPRSRANSRPTPYPKNPPRSVKMSPKARRAHNRTQSTEIAFASIAPYDPTPSSPPPSLAPVSSMGVPFQSTANLRKELVQPGPKVTTNIRRGALGWGRRKPTEPEIEDCSKKSVVSPVMRNTNVTSACGKENKEREATGMLTRYVATYFHFVLLLMIVIP